MTLAIDQHWRPMQWQWLLILWVLRRAAGWICSLPIEPHYHRFSGDLERHDGRIAAAPVMSQEVQEQAEALKNGTVTVLDRGQHYVVISKPPSVACHHSGWTGSRSSHKNKQENNGQPEIPMLQRVRQAMGGQKVNLVHRLDRGASGCLLFTFADDDGNQNATSTMIQAMAVANKTYVALVRGEGILKGDDLKQKGWFCVTRPIRNENGFLHNATTHFRFVAGQDNGQGSIDRPRASLVLARPITGRWHQVRKHLNGLSHPILGDSTHGSSRDNREWREQWGMPKERTCLHLNKLILPSTTSCPEGINVSCPLPSDMMSMLQDHLPQVLRDATSILEQEGIFLFGRAQDNITVLPFELTVKAKVR